MVRINDSLIENYYKDNKEIKANFITDSLLDAVYILEKL